MDASAVDRILLQSSKPSLHTNVDCSALIAAVVSRQVATVRLLLKVICTSLSVYLYKLMMMLIEISSSLLPIFLHP